MSEWESQNTGIRYPNRVEIEAAHPVSGETATFILTPKIPNQEFDSKQSDTTYWEGACRVTSPDSTEMGNAYLELTGYGESLGTKL